MFGVLVLGFGVLRLRFRVCGLGFGSGSGTKGLVQGLRAKRRKKRRV